MILVVHGAFSMDQEKNGPFMDIVKLIAAPRLNYIYDDVLCCLTHITWVMDDSLFLLTVKFRFESIFFESKRRYFKSGRLEKTHL